jgi:hypothetical protein
MAQIVQLPAAARNRSIALSRMKRSTRYNDANVPAEEPMIRSSPRLDELERRYQREAFRDLTLCEALDRFAALWAEARQLDPSLGEDWRADLEADLAVARAVNDLPPA